MIIGERIRLRAIHRDDLPFYVEWLNRIFLRVYENNPRAMRSYEKAGLVQEGRLRQGHYQNGVYFDVILMSMLRSEWQKSGTNTV